MKFKRKIANVVWLATVASSTWAADAPVAVVNGVSIDARLMERNVQANVAQGQGDTPALRAALKDELIARELLLQESLRRGLDKRKDSEDALQALRQNYLIDVLLQDELSKHPVTEAELKTEYERQVKALSANDIQQYQLAAIVLDSEAEARNVMAALRAGQSFESQAKSKSVDPSKERGGDIGWLLPDQITPAISNVVVNLSVGTVSVAPIQVGPYWHVVKLLGKRPYKVPGFSESKELITAAVMQGRRAVFLKKLQDSARIIR
jgi:peptidyl-prolyl cis-trans isomerase C